MPQYYFHVLEDIDVLDLEGSEHDDDAAAKAYGVAAVRALAAETATRGYVTRHHRLEIEDAAHLPVATIRFDEAVEIRG